MRDSNICYIASETQEVFTKKIKKEKRKKVVIVVVSRKIAQNSTNNTSK